MQASYCPSRWQREALACRKWPEITLNQISAVTANPRHNAGLVGLGLGWVIYDAKEFLNADVKLAALAVIGCIGFGFERLAFGLLGRATIQRWAWCGRRKGSACRNRRQFRLKLLRNRIRDDDRAIESHRIDLD